MTAQHQGLTPEQMQLFIKLEGIFMPHARRQRDALYGASSGTEDGGGKKRVRFVHYTSAEAALSIIKNKRIWMRNTTCMADFREVQHGFDLLRAFFDKSGAELFSQTLDPFAPGAAMEAINLFNQWWESFRVGTYITSISEHDDSEDLHGRLSMWRAFGGNSARVAIVFEVPWSSGGAQALNLMFSPVAYLTNDQMHSVINEVIANIQVNGDFLRSLERSLIVGMVFSMLLGAVTCLKHEGFREEREWRAIYSPQFRPSPLMKLETQVIGGVPQTIYQLPLDARVSPVLADLDFSRMFDRLIIGPSPYPVVMYEAFRAELANIGVVDADKKIFVSNIPIRS